MFGDERGTCSTNGKDFTNIDFFIVDARVARLAKGGQRRDGAGTSPHLPVECEFTNNVEREWATFFAAPALDIKVPVGPRQAPPEWENFSGYRATIQNELADNHTLVGKRREKGEEFLDKSTAVWLDMAREDLAGALHLTAEKAGEIGGELVFKDLPLDQGLHTKKASFNTPSVAAAWAKGHAVEFTTLLLRWRTTPQTRQTVKRITKIAFALATVFRPDGVFAKHFNSDEGAAIAKGLQELGCLTLCAAARFQKQPGAVAASTQLTAATLHLQCAAASLEIVEAKKRATEWRREPGGWRLWAHDATQGAASKGHRWIKEPLRWEPEIGEDECGQESVAATAVLRKYHKKFASTWETSTVAKTRLRGKQSVGTKNPLADAALPLLPRPTPDEIRSTARSFKEKTANPDGLHPRAFAVMSDGALEALGWLILLIEATGDFPAVMRSIVVALYRKQGGKARRAIGFYRGLVRLCERLRRSHLATWKKSINNQGFNVTKTRATTDAVWRRAVRAEHAVGEQQSACVAFWDLKEFYETIGHTRLAEEGAATGYPLILLRLSISTYRWPRFLQLDRLIAKALFPTSGIVAGSFSATFEAKAFLIQIGRRMCQRHKEVQLGIHIDDLALETCSPSGRQAAESIADAAEDLKAQLEEAGLKIAESKEAIVASDPLVLLLVRRAFGKIGLGKTAFVAPDLGVDFTCGKSSTTRNKGNKRTRTKRASKGKIRMGRFMRLKAAAGKSAN